MRQDKEIDAWIHKVIWLTENGLKAHVNWTVALNCGCIKSQHNNSVASAVTYKNLERFLHKYIYMLVNVVSVVCVDVIDFK